jgi:hypothetical protein
VLVPAKLARRRFEREHRVVGVGDIQKPALEDRAATHLCVGHETPEQPTIARRNLVERAVVRAEVHGVFAATVEGRAVDEAECLETPENGAVFGAHGVKAVIARAHEDAMTDNVELGLASLVRLAHHT